MWYDTFLKFHSLFQSKDEPEGVEGEDGGKLLSWFGF
jgi:hypothetical protein